MRVVFKKSIIDKINREIDYNISRPRVIESIFLNNQEYDEFIWWVKPVGCTAEEYIHECYCRKGAVFHRGVKILLEE